MTENEQLIVIGIAQTCSHITKSMLEFLPILEKESPSSMARFQMKINATMLEFQKIEDLMNQEWSK